jgi:hypothetical protein
MDSAGLLTCVNYCCVTDIKSGQINSQNTILIYPNPFSSQVKVNNLKYGNAEIIICDMQGKVVLRRNVNNNESLYLNSLKAGIYIFKVIERNDARAIRLIKQ